MGCIYTDVSAPMAVDWFRGSRCGIDETKKKKFSTSSCFSFSSRLSLDHEVSLCSERLCELQECGMYWKISQASYHSMRGYSLRPVLKHFFGLNHHGVCSVEKVEERGYVPLEGVDGGFIKVLWESRSARLWIRESSELIGSRSFTSRIQTNHPSSVLLLQHLSFAQQPSPSTSSLA